MKTHSPKKVFEPFGTDLNLFTDLIQGKLKKQFVLKNLSMTTDYLNIFLHRKPKIDNYNYLFSSSCSDPEFLSNVTSEELSSRLLCSSIDDVFGSILASEDGSISSATSKAKDVVASLGLFFELS